LSSNYTVSCWFTYSLLIPSNPKGLLDLDGFAGDLDGAAGQRRECGFALGTGGESDIRPGLVSYNLQRLSFVQIIRGEMPLGSRAVLRGTPWEVPNDNGSHLPCSPCTFPGALGGGQKKVTASRLGRRFRICSSMVCRLARCGR